MVKPDLNQISDYMLERGFNEEDQPEAFFDHFESNGWKVGKNPMKNWQAAIRTWIRNTMKWSKRNESTQRHNNNNQSQADRIHQQANQAREQLAGHRAEVYQFDDRPLRSIG